MKILVVLVLLLNKMVIHIILQTINDNGVVRYNCMIINLFDRSVIASLNGDHITSELAIATLKKAIRRHKPKKG